MLQKAGIIHVLRTFLKRFSKTLQSVSNHVLKPFFKRYVLLGMVTLEAAAPAVTLMRLFESNLSFGRRVNGNKWCVIALRKAQRKDGQSKSLLLLYSSWLCDIHGRTIYLHSPTHPCSLNLTYNLNQTCLPMYCYAPHIDHSCIMKCVSKNFSTFLKRFKIEKFISIIPSRLYKHFTNVFKTFEKF